MDDILVLIRIFLLIRVIRRLGCFWEQVHMEVLFLNILSHIGNQIG